jgi:transposase InsO family protein
LERGWSLAAAAEAAGVSVVTARKWVARWAAGERQLLDRSSAPRRIPHRTPRQRVEAIEALRRLRLTAAEIAAALGMALSTVSVWLKRLGLGKRSRLEPPEPPNRYERRRPGELVHIDVKKLGRIRGVGHRVTADRGPGKRNRGIGWDFVHVCIDDYSRLAYVEIQPDEHPATAVAFLRRALGWFAQRGVRVERVMTDNGNPYRSQLHNIACRELELKHLRTRPYRPRTNGKAERFIQTLLREWAYGPVYGSTNQRTQALQSWLKHYNYTRPHGSLSHKPPGSRLNNQARNYS